MERLGERWTRNPDSSIGKVPEDMSFEEWRAAFVDGGSKDGLTKGADGDILNAPKKPTVKLTDKEQWALNEYISSGSYKVNAPLRMKLPLSDEQIELIQALDSALEKMPTYQGTVYRSLDSSMIPNLNTFWREHTPGSVVRYPAYTSSGTTVYDETMDIQLVIQSKRGKDIRVYNPGESEILFKRRSKFLVIDRKENTLWLEEI